MGKFLKVWKLLQKFVWKLLQKFVECLNARMNFPKDKLQCICLVFVEINGNGTYRDIVGDPSILR